MKRIAYVWLAATILGGSLTVLARAQSEPLGDYARAVRKEKKQEKLESGKRFDNDNLPKTDKLSVVGNATQEPASLSSDADAQAAQISSARRCFLRRRRQTCAQRGFVGKRRRTIQAAAGRETKKCEYRQRRTARHEGAGSQGGSSLFYDPIG